MSSDGDDDGAEEIPRADVVNTRRSLPRGYLSNTVPAQSSNDRESYSNPDTAEMRRADAFLEFEQKVDAQPEHAVKVLSMTDKDMSMIMNLLKDTIQQCVPRDRDEILNAMAAHVDIVPRAEEEQFLREAIHGEQVCSNGKACQGMKIQGLETLGRTPVPLVAFHSMRQRMRAEAEKKPLPPSLCVLCYREVAAHRYMNSRCEGIFIGAAGAGHRNVLTEAMPYANFVGFPEEYHISQVINTGNPETHGGLWPIALLNLRWLRPWLDSNGVLCFAQVGYLPGNVPLGIPSQMQLTANERDF